MNIEKSDISELDKLKNEIQDLNKRLTSLEISIQASNSLQVRKEDNVFISKEEEFELKLPFQSNDSIEFKVGEYGMAWIGNIILFFGVIFLFAFLQNSGNSVSSVLAGFTCVAGIYICSGLTKKSYLYLSKLLAFNGHILLFYLATQLHFFQENPIIKNQIFGLIVIIIVLGSLLYLAYSKKSQILAGIVLLMVLITGVISNIISISAVLTMVAAVISLLFYYKFAWLKLVFVFIILIYVSYLNILLNNPFAGNNPEFVASPGVALLYFIGTGFICSVLAFIPKNKSISNEFVITTVVLNGLGFTVLLAIIIVTYFQNNFVPIFISIAVFCLAYSLILQLRSIFKIIASMYALYGFLAMSVAVYGKFGMPNSYLLFSLQSLLVVSMALWFRSRFIVVMNALLFVVLMAFYLFDSNSFNSTNLSFMLVAFISARVINWKKERLNIKTEFLRDLYLLAGLLMTLITFYHLSPSSYITASWILAAVFLFVLSLLLKNKKYRWMAIATIVAAAARLIFIDMSSINIGYRVLVFMVLAVFSITISILYTKFFAK